MEVVYRNNTPIKQFERRTGKIELPYIIKYKEINSFIKFFNENREDYNFYIYVNKDPPKKISNDSIYINKKLSMKELRNLFYYLNYDDFETKKIKIEDNNSLIVSATQNNSTSYSARIKNKNLSSITTFFGIENYNILKHVNSDRIEELSQTELGKRSLKQLDKYRAELNNLENSDDEKYFMILSSMVLFAIGTTTAMDVDPIIYNKQGNKNIIKVSKNMEKKYIDLIILNKNNCWYCAKTQKEEQWLSTEISEKWISKVGAKDIKDIFTDSKHHFYFRGFKFISIKLQLERLEKRNRATAYADLIAYKLFNNNSYQIQCVLPYKFQQNKISIYNNKTYNDLIEKIKCYLEEWHSLHFSIKKLKNLIKLCEGYDKYKVDVKTKGLFMDLRKYHQFIKSYYLYKYCKNCNSLIDVGSASLKSLKFWDKTNIKYIVALEPSEDLFNTGLLKLKKYEGNKEIVYINSVGEKFWDNGDAGFGNKNIKKLISIKNKKFDCITFEFTIHYMTYNYPTLMKNIDNHSKKGTTVIIHCMDGDLVNKFTNNKHKTYQVFLNKKLVYSVHKIKNNRIKVYLKGAQGLDNVVEESIVNPKQLISEFEKKNFVLDRKENFMEHNPEKFKMKIYEMEVSKLYMTYVFKKIN